MDGPRSTILIDLADGHVRNHAGNCDLDVRVLQRQAVDSGIAAFHEKEWGEGLVNGWWIALRCGDKRHEQGADGVSNDGPANL